MGRLLAFAIAIMAVCEAVAGDSPYTRSHGVDVIAHRGASAYAPENTLAAFALAIEMGADWFELDCSLSKDGEVIVIHDDTVDRTTDGVGVAADLTLRELKALDAGTWKHAKYAGEPIPTLEESLGLGQGRIGVYVEIKDSDDDTVLRAQILKRIGEGTFKSDKVRAQTLALIRQSGTKNYALTRKVIKLIRARNLGDDVVIQSFSPIICAVALVEAPEIRTDYLAEDLREAPEHWTEVVQWIALLDPSGFNPNRRAMRARSEFMSELRDKGASIAVWTVDGAREQLLWAEWGVTRIITNRPDDCIKILSDAGLR